jgi:hypothetical protein
MFKLSIKSIPLLFATCLANQQVYSCGIEISDTIKKPAGKELYIPSKVWKVPENNNFKNDTSEYFFGRMKESKSIALFWAKRFGNDPLANPDLALRFSPDNILNEGERIYEYYVNDLKFVEKGKRVKIRL